MNRCNRHPTRPYWDYEDCDQPTYHHTNDWSVAADITNGTATALVLVSPENHVIIGHRTDRNPAWTREGYTTGEDIAATLEALLDA